MPGYVTGGAIPSESDAYIPRSIDDSAYAELTAGNWVIVLAPRQQGKTSALARLTERLRADGFHSGIIDFQAYGGSGSYRAFLEWTTQAICRELNIAAPAPSNGADDLESWLDLALVDLPNIALLLDEVSAVPTTHRQRFFSQLRALHSRRARDSADALSRRVGFAFVGTFRPEQLIDSANSPFLVSQEIVVDDLDVDGIGGLAERLSGPEVARYADRVFEVVGGQPYLTQLLLAAVERGESPEDREARFAHAVRALQEERNPHITYLFQLVRSDPGLVEIVQALLASPGGIVYKVGDPDYDFAQVAGIAVSRGGQLHFRNPLYRSLAERVFGSDELSVSPEPAGVEVSVDVLVVTATHVETAAVREAFLGSGAVTPPRIFGRANSYLDLGVVGGLTVAHVQSAAIGSGGAGGATLTVSEAIAELRPKQVIMVGIAFGIDSADVRLSEVLVGQRIMGYELQRVGTGRAIPRGERVSASPSLVGLFESAAHDWHGGRVKIGLLLSGDKLIDDIDFRNQLREIEPEAIGGEMEAVGLEAAARREHVDWIVVKACADFADGNKRARKAQRQKKAAAAAASFTHFALNLEGRRI
jgi:nucleoside phosphorylase